MTGCRSRAQRATIASDPKLRERLALTRRLLDFAEQELKMPSEGAYELYAELDRKHLVWGCGTGVNRN